MRRRRWISGAAVPGLEHRLLFTFLPTESGDGTTRLSSLLRAEAQDKANRLHGFEQSH